MVSSSLSETRTGLPGAANPTGPFPKAAQETKAPKKGPAPPPDVVAGIPVNYDEAKVGNYTLPDPLTLADGKPVRDAMTWTEKRRPEIVKLFVENQ